MTPKDTKPGLAKALLIGGALAGLVPAAAGLVASTWAHADETAPAVLADSCQECHGTGGTSPGAIPPIAGLEAAVIEERLQAFRSDPEATIMGRISRGYTDAEIAALAAEIAGWPAE
jgi:cytochrome c553